MVSFGVRLGLGLEFTLNLTLITNSNPNTNPNTKANLANTFSVIWFWSIQFSHNPFSSLFHLIGQIYTNLDNLAPVSMR